jgi:4-diphosphocytidyl-2-C-methyl-D-erythritol kinase
LLSAFAFSAPAKINLFLAVTGRRPDGFHDLISVAAPLAWGDTISVQPQAEGFSIECDAEGIPTDGTNLVAKAARAFAAETGWSGGARFVIAKRIPAGAGLGGASSDAVSALRALNALAGSPLAEEGFSRLAPAIGSDCALFLPGGPVVMRGRGERVEPLAAAAARRLRGQRILVFKPSFAIATPWAYARLAETAANYSPERESEARLASWIAEAAAPLGALLFNSMERPAFAKFPALPLVLESVRRRFGVAAAMSGSGSACFALLDEGADAVPISGAIRAAWGPSALVVDTRIA